MYRCEPRVSVTQIQNRLRVYGVDVIQVGAPVSIEQVVSGSTGEVFTIRSVLPFAENQPTKQAATITEVVIDASGRCPISIWFYSLSPLKVRSTVGRSGLIRIRVGAQNIFTHRVEALEGIMLLINGVRLKRPLPTL